jgi:hypothetical protein
VLHFYWALGGKIAFAEALPTNQVGHRALNPTKIQSAAVGFFLLVFALNYAVILLPHLVQFPPMLLSILGWLIVAIFFLRAVGDFNYVGFFKKIKNTEFAKQDSRYYSPLCLVMSCNGILVELFFRGH